MKKKTQTKKPLPTNKFLNSLGINKAQQRNYINAGITDREKLINWLPRKYTVYPYVHICPFAERLDLCIRGLILKTEDRGTYVQSYVKSENGYFITIFEYNKSKATSLYSCKGKPVFICGTFSYNGQYNNFSCTPFLITEDYAETQRIFPVYRKPKGIDHDTLARYIYKTVNSESIPDIIPDDIRRHFVGMTREDAYIAAHQPLSQTEITNAYSYFLIEKLYLFAKGMVERYTKNQISSDIKIGNIPKTMSMINSLPFPLTRDQKGVSDELIGSMQSGIRLNCLVQGDVSCGKTLVADILIFAMTENGYQSALIAPTTILARQHYEKLESLNKFGFRILMLESEMKNSEKQKAYESIKSGDYDIVVGTTAILSDNVAFKNLGLVITDEEHRFGVEQKNKLTEKGAEGVHIVSMSATPIPRSLAQVLYTGSTIVKNIRSMPPGRVPVSTFVCNRNNAVKKIREESEKGYRTYIICPKIEDSDTSQRVSVELLEKEYRRLLPDLNIGTVNGRLKQDEIQDKIKEFRDGKYDVLISTTVVEVGVDVPNATLIIIEDADMFGLSQLHQLRGRVGRSSIPSYCFLIPSENISEDGKKRLQILCSTTDGFVIAEEDMKLRGPGELLGTKQSGDDDGIRLALKYPNTYREIINMIQE